MVNYICTRFKDSDGLDLGCHLIPKEYLLEKYPALQEWVKAPALWGWGSSNIGQLGDNTIVGKSSPVQTISTSLNWRSVCIKNFHVSATKADGTLWTWGSNAVGQLGSGAAPNRSSPIQTVSGGTNWRSISTGGAISGAIKTDGTLWMWGQGLYGAMGNNSGAYRTSPVQTISAGNNWAKISTGGAHVVAIKTDGTLWTWGRGASGRLGNNSIVSASSPIQTISSGTNWKEISAGNYNTVAIKTDGTLWVWGVGTFGSLGNNTGGTTAFRSSPVQTVSNVTTWKQVSAGLGHIASIKTDGSLWTWGYNANGQLGNNSIAHVSSPIQTVSGGTNWMNVQTAYYHTGAIKTDGTLWLWGKGTSGQLGDNTIISKSSPIQTITGGTSWRSVSPGNYTTFAISDEGNF